MSLWYGKRSELMTRVACLLWITTFSCITSGYIGSMIQSFPSERELSRAVSMDDGSRSFASLFIHRQPPAVLEPTYACSTFMDNCTSISLSKPKARCVLRLLAISWRRRSPQRNEYKISRMFLDIFEIFLIRKRSFYIYENFISMFSIDLFFVIVFSKRLHLS